MKFDQSIWGGAVSVIRQNLNIFATVVIAIWLVDTMIMAFDPDGQTPIYLTFIAGAYLAVASHATVLRNISGFKAIGSLENKTLPRFLLRTGAIALMGFVPAVIAMIAVMSSPEVKAYGEDARFIFSMLIAAVAYGIVMLVALGLFGTWLPAAVVGDGSSIGRALARGRKTMGYAVSRLIIGPGANVALFLISLFLLPLEIPDAVLFYTIHVGGLQFVPFDILLNGFGNVVWATGTVLIAVVLSRAYQLGEARLPSDSAPDAEAQQPEAA